MATDFLGRTWADRLPSVVLLNDGTIVNATDFNPNTMTVDASESGRVTALTAAYNARVAAATAASTAATAAETAVSAAATAAADQVTANTLNNTL